MSLIPHTKTKTTTTTPSSSSSSSSSKGSGNGQACAACKYQRRKCAPDCVLAPYFPHDTQRQFLNAHKLFGVSNITKIIRKLDSPAARDHAMRTIIFQSDARAADPVGGCYRIIQDLQRQIDFAKAELDLVLQHLELCRAAAAAAAVPPPQSTSSHDDHFYNDTMHSELHHHQHDQFLHPQVIHGELEASRYVVVDQDRHEHLQDDVSSWVVQDSVMDVKPVTAAIGGVVGGDQDVHVGKPLLEVSSDVKIINGVATNFEPHHHRDDEAMLRTVGHNVVLKQENQDDHYSIQRNDEDDEDLRDAATLFTLTNCTS
ncbi:Lateral organ boundaries domain containing protein [Trema orientale]|uniref:Lateral organ boundaries domain containing protein n=1 Tax=Trema orientale TaxID=63057 RepID=A0A2P5FEC7_TREOI|nr:Lateral organ boundaries domain containing protein [Trema orientale]